MNIVFVIPSLNGGGAERVITLLSKKFTDHGNTVHIITTSYTKKLSYDLDKRVTRHNLCCNKNIGVIKKITKIRAIFKEIKPDIAISFMPNSDFLVLMSTFGKKTIRICSERNSPKDYPTNIYLRALRLLCFRFANAIVFQTEGAKKYFGKKIKNKGVVINNPIFIGKQNYSGSINEKQNRIIAVGRLYEQKNFELLIDSFHLYIEKGGSLFLNIYGDGPLLSSLNKRIEQYKLKDKITIYPFSKNIWSEIYNSRIFCLTSKFEGIPNVLLEAESIGIPVVSVDCRPGGAKLLVENNYNGILVDNFNPNAFADALMTVTSKIDFFTKNALEYTRTINEKFSLEIIASQWLELFKDLTNDKEKREKYVQK